MRSVGNGLPFSECLCIFFLLSPKMHVQPVGYTPRGKDSGSCRELIFQICKRILIYIVLTESTIKLLSWTSCIILLHGDWKFKSTVSDNNVIEKNYKSITSIKMATCSNRCESHRNSRDVDWNNSQRSTFPQSHYGVNHMTLLYFLLISQILKCSHSDRHFS